MHCGQYLHRLICIRQSFVVCLASSLLRPGFSRVARRSTYKSNVAKRLAKGMNSEKNDKGKEKQQANYVSFKTVISFPSRFKNLHFCFTRATLVLFAQCFSFELIPSRTYFSSRTPWRIVVRDERTWRRG